MRFDALRQGFRDARDSGQLVSGRHTNLIHISEMFQEGFSLCWTDSGDAIQLGGHADLGAPLAVGGDPEAVGFVADALDEVKRLGMTGEHQRFGFVGKEYLLLAFGQPHHRYLVGQLEFLQHFDRAPKLPLASVNDNQVG